MSDTVALRSAGTGAGTGRPARGPVARLWAPAPDVTVALARTDAVLATPAALDRLRPEEHASAAAMAAWRAREHLAGRVLLRLLLADVTGEADARAPVVPEPGGRPRLPGSPRTGVSISHSGPYVAAAVGVGLDVGVDVQVPRPPSSAMVRRCCPPETALRLASLSPEPAAEVFARIWTVQEACVKARGTGLSGAPWRVRAEPDGQAGSWGALLWRRAAQPAPAGGEKAALACAYGPAAQPT
ncbi:4'-phosphopantetheinyl transferase family protein [Streptomyces sp. NPDC057438]|uniref:4'-phosphopantetheinyl transferase family protein n=1 Tax=Streptomyces sp. NPDC057438 TaxID=3346133 RepID=UPI0036B2D201